MKIAALIARYLLAVAFLVFGLNGFLHFLPQPPMADGPAARFATALATTHYMDVVMAIQVVCGLLFLIGRFVPLALTLIAPVIVNILLFHIFMLPKGLPPGIVIALLWAILAYYHRAAFAGILQPRPVRATEA